jgi:hypothetical protein
MLAPNKKDATIFRLEHLLGEFSNSQERMMIDLNTEGMQIKKLLRLNLLMIVLITVSCQKSQNESNLDNLLGTWISTDKSDTLYFIDAINLYNSNTTMHYDHYNYGLINDSIKIGYSGRLYIYVLPTMHSFHLEGNKLSIDFSKKNCYGFDVKVMNYTKR